MADFVNLLPTNSHEDDPNLSGGVSGLHRVHCFSLEPRIIDVFEVPWIGPNPSQYQRGRYIRLYLDWIRKGDERDHEEARAKAIDIVSKLLPPVDCWTDAETMHFDFLVDRQYWWEWFAKVIPQPIWPWVYFEPVFFPPVNYGDQLIHRPLRTIMDRVVLPLPSCDNGKSEIETRKDECSASQDSSSSRGTVSRAINRMIQYNAR